MDIIKPISNDINEPSTIQIIANSQIASDPATNNYQYDESKDRKYIIPLALKTTSTLEKESIPPPVQLQSPASNIDDLKRHILMLQNFTKNDKNFQSKFVVFPKLQRNTTEAPTVTSTVRPIRTTSMPFPVTMYRTKPTINMARDMHLHNSQILRDVSYPYNRNVERATVVPQVFLQNDQTPESTAEEMEANAKELRKKKKERRRKNNLEKQERKERRNKKNQSTTTTTTTTTTTPAPPARKSLKRNQNRKKNNKDEKIPLRDDRQSTTGRKNEISVKNSN